MKKVLGFAMLTLAILFSSCTEKENKDVLELVSAETVTVSAKGGEVAIEVKSSSELTAESSAGWAKAAVVDKNNVKVVVDAYDGNETRTATVTISNAGNTESVSVRINQAAVNFTFAPADYEFEAEGGQYSFPYDAEAELKATAEDASWLTIEVKEKELVLTAAANEAIKTRNADVAWNIGAAKGTFSVSQKGAAATLESADFVDGNFKAVVAPREGTEVSYEYTTNSELEVSSDEDWIETYTEGGKFFINVLFNNGDAREGSVAWSVKGSATLKGEISVSQKGSILKINSYPYDYSAQYTSANTFLVRIETTNCTDVRRELYQSNVFTGNESYSELLAAGRSCNTVVNTNFTIEKFNQAGGMGMITPMSSIPANKTIAVLVYATDGESEQVEISYVQFSNGDQNGTYTLNNLKKKSSKEEYYGGYHAFFNTTYETTSDFQGIGAQGNIVISDGEAAVNESGQTVELVKISGLWNTQFNYRVSLNDDMYYYYIDGLLYSYDQDLDILYFDGEAYSNGKLSTLTAMSDDKLYVCERALAGGVINDEGYIAFVPNTGDDDLMYTSTWLVDGEGYWCVAKDFILIPDGAPASASKVAAAQAKVNKIKKTMKPMKGNGSYVESADIRFQRALNIVNAEERAALAPVASLN